MFGIMSHGGNFSWEDITAEPRSRFCQEATLPKREREDKKMSVIANDQECSSLEDTKLKDTETEVPEVKATNLEGNSLAVIQDLRSRAEDHKSKMEDHRRKRYYHQSLTEEHQDKMFDLMWHIDILESGSKPWIEERRMFLATYEKNVANSEDHSQTAINEENRTRQYSDAYADALLFESSNPPNAATYMALYGVGHDLILRHCKCNAVLRIEQT